MNGTAAHSNGHKSLPSCSLKASNTPEHSNGKGSVQKEYEEGQCLWTPEKGHVTNLQKFRKFINREHQTNFTCYAKLYAWSISDYASFWGSWWSYGGFLSAYEPDAVVDANANIASIPKWFPGVRLNFAENLLRFNDDRVALYVTGEGSRGQISNITYRALRRRVGRLSLALKALGVGPSVVVAGYVPNSVTAVEAMLATAALGGIWAAASPDFGVMGVLDRFSQIQPSVLVSVEGVVYNGKVHDHVPKLRQVVEALPSVKAVVMVPFARPKEEIDISTVPNCIFMDDLLAEFAADSSCDFGDIEFARVPFHHPQFIMFSSGTTGAAKCIVHSVGGTLIQIAKEHVLHCDLNRDDVMMYYTTTGWMMWHWMVVGLFSGCSLVLYDGSPLLPTPNAIWNLVDRLGISVLGTGAKWLSVLERLDVRPRATHALDHLRMILSTGSPLSDASFKYVYEHVKPSLLLGSITGGTDIISCFMGANPCLPVHSGEIQCKMLGMAMEIWDEEGRPVLDRSGELVCTKPFPSMPTHFWNDDGGIKYTKAYFSKHSGVWVHGDVCVESSQTGGIRMMGRSDGTLNPNGVRFGSSEIYNIVERFLEVRDSLCIGQRSKDGEERFILFVVLESNYKLNSAEGEAELPADLIRKLKTEIRTQLSARHVPSLILPVDDIPYTVSGKKVEVAARQMVHGQPVLNRGSLANPQSLDLYSNIPLLQSW